MIVGGDGALKKSTRVYRVLDNYYYTDYIDLEGSESFTVKSISK